MIGFTVWFNKEKNDYGIQVVTNNGYGIKMFALSNSKDERCMYKQCGVTVIKDIPEIDPDNPTSVVKEIMNKMKYAPSYDEVAFGMFIGNADIFFDVVEFIRNMEVSGNEVAN